MSKEDLSKIRGQVPISVIVHGGNYISFQLAKTLLEQGSHVVIIDRYTNTSKQYFTELKRSGRVSFIDFKGIKSFYEKIARIDYLYYMLGQKVESMKNADSKDFLSETDYLNQSLTCANKYKAKISLITSLRLNRELSNRINNEQVGKTKPYSPLELQRYGENFAAEYVDKTKANLRIIRLGTILGKGLPQIFDDILHKLFLDATQKAQIEIEGEGLEIHNIVHESDAIYGILKLTFSDDTKGEVISLCNKNDYSTLSMAYKLLELDVEAKAIKFTERQNDIPILQDLYVPAPNATQYGWKQNISLEETTIDQVKAYYERSDKKWEIDKINDRKKATEKRISNVSKTKLGAFLSSLLEPFNALRKPKELFTKIDYPKIVKNVLLSVLFISLIYFLIAPVIGILIGGSLVYKDGNDLKNSVTELDFDKIQRNSSSLSNNIKRVENSFERVYWIFKITGMREEYSNLFQVVQGTKYISESTENLVVGLRPFGQYIKDFEPSIEFDNEESSSTIKEYSQYLEAIDDNKYQLQEGIFKMSLAQSVIDRVDTRHFPKFITTYVLQYKDLIEQINDTVKPLEKVSQFLPEILGLDERKRYLILLQDNGEIRSTGGWLSSYAVVAIEDGQIRELFVDDIYNAQALLKLKGETYRSPYSLTEALPSVPFSFPLVNWNPNMDRVLLSSEQFVYDLEKGNSLDGVITVDLVFIQKILDKWGGVQVPGESDLVTSANLYQNIFETYSGEKAEDIRKSTFLTDFFDAVVTKIFSSKLTTNTDLYSAISESINEKHILFTFKNSIARAYADENGWDGNLDSKFQSAPIDIDWNWGGNKANLYIKKNHTLDVDIKDENTIDYSYQIAVQNDSSKEEYPQGEYKNYVRIYIPYNATVTSIRGITGNKYSIYEEDGYKIIAGWFNIPIKETYTLEIKYRIERGENSSDFFIQKTDSHYKLDLDIYKQPGSRKDAYNFSLTYPDTWIIESSDGLTRIENNVNRRFELASDQHFYISWQR
ncbi:DUF4012 domain-containing protein [Candidatus Dojkabacteria bacterium]|nr:DUF4012 domain-containing protein [Candidatus Dojkabacteria bacterium]